MARRIPFLLLPVLLLAGACSSGDDVPGPEAAGGTVVLDEVELTSALTPFDSCDALLAHLTDEASERVGPYGLEGESPMVLEGDMAFDEDGGFASAGSDRLIEQALPAPVTTVPTSGTNTQEAFVDEPDLVKVTPDRMLVADEGVLRVIDISGDAPVQRGHVDLPGWDNQLLVVGDRVLALGHSDDGWETDDAGTSWEPYGYGAAVLAEIDVSDPDAPAVVHTLEVSGAYLSARLVGETARVVLSAAHPQFPFVYPSDDSPAARRIAEEANRRLIEEATLDDWLPGATLDGEAVDLVDCTRVEQPADFSGFGFLSVLTVDLTQPLGTPVTTSVLADGQTVYASAESLYVATTELEGDRTTLHRFDITGTGAATWLASGEVPGRLLNQFSMSEHEGRLRVATTEGSSSRVAVLETDGQALTEVGAVDGLGPDEEIYAVRFLGDTGYVVTFRQMDPLFVIDLSDPTDPTLQGELHIPGYSAYLHPIDDTHLLGIGQDATDQGITTGLQISLFDVGDPAAPTRVDQVMLPGDQSEAEWDHHAFLHWQPTGQAALPIWEGSLVLSVGPDHVDEQGRVDVEDGQQVFRNVVVGDRLYTVGTQTITVSRLADLQPVAELAL